MIMQSFTTCELNFWVYMTKDDPNTHLEISAQIGTEPRTIYWLDYNTHSEWAFVKVMIGRQHTPLMFLLTAFPGEGDNVIAIDDMDYTNCEFPKPEENCNEEKFICSNKVCIDRNEVCDHADNCGDNSDEIKCEDYISCNFEDTSMCSWENIDNDGGR